jgi:hypothetical protein
MLELAQTVHDKPSLTCYNRSLLFYRENRPRLRSDLGIADYLSALPVPESSAP